MPTPTPAPAAMASVELYPQPLARLLFLAKHTPKQIFFPISKSLQENLEFLVVKQFWVLNETDCSPRKQNRQPKTESCESKQNLAT